MHNHIACFQTLTLSRFDRSSPVAEPKGVFLAEDTFFFVGVCGGIVDSSSSSSTLARSSSRRKYVPGAHNRLLLHELLQILRQQREEARATKTLMQETVISLTFAMTFQRK
jgi:hypothetical protein